MTRKRGHVREARTGAYKNAQPLQSTDNFDKPQSDTFTLHTSQRRMSANNNEKNAGFTVELKKLYTRNVTKVGGSVPRVKGTLAKLAWV